MPTSNAVNPDSLNRCAILLLSLGEEVAADVFKSLNTHEVQQLGKAMAGLTQITREEVTAVLEDFHQEVAQFQAVTLGSYNYVESVLTKALGSERAARMIEEILEADNHAAGMDALNWMEPAGVAELIHNEHPQIIATILIHLQRDRASAVLALLPERLRNDVMLRIATFGGVQPAAFSELTEVLNQMLSGQNAKRNKMGGVRTAAEILNMMSTAEEEQIITNLRDLDADLAQKIVDEMFIFEHLADMEDRAIQCILKEIDTASLTIALKGVPDELRNKFYKNMSTRAAEMLRDDIEAQGPVRMSKVEQEQKAILQVVRRLAEEGQFTLGGGKDDYV